MASGPVPGGAASSGVQKCSSSAIVLTSALCQAASGADGSPGWPSDLAAMPTVIPATPLWWLGRAADHGVGSGRDPERFGDLIEQCLGPGVVCLHDQLAEPGRVAGRWPLRSTRVASRITASWSTASTAGRSPRHRSSATGQRVRCSETASSYAR